LSELGTSAELQFVILTHIIGKKLLLGFNNIRYFECFNEFLMGLHYHTSPKLDDLLKNYEDAYQNYYLPYMQEHEYILENTSYDYEINESNNYFKNPESHEIYNLLVKGIGVCDAHADAFKLLLALCGIDSEVVIGISGDLSSKINNHAWNAVKIDGEYYAVDVTWDNNLEDEMKMLSYKYFNIPGKSMSKDHKWEETMYRQCPSDKYGYFSGLELAARVEDCIYYSNESDGYKLYKIKIDGTGKQKLNNHKSLFMDVKDGWIYYSDYQDGGTLHKISTEGSGSKKLNNDWSINIKATGDWIEYANKDSNNSKYRIRTDGSGRQKLN
jgi:hypothetical protein